MAALPSVEQDRFLDGHRAGLQQAAQQYYLESVAAHPQMAHLGPAQSIRPNGPKPAGAILYIPDASQPPRPTIAATG